MPLPRAGIGLLVARQLVRIALAGPRVLGAFPWRQEVPVAPLHRFHRLVDHPLQLVVVADLDVAGHREVLAQRMPVEAVIREQAPQVRVPFEEDAVHVERLALEPVGGWVDADHRRNRRILVGLDLDADAQVLGEREQVIDHVEATLALRIVGAGHVDQLLEFEVIAQAGEQPHDAQLRRSGDRRPGSPRRRTLKALAAPSESATIRSPNSRSASSSTRHRLIARWSPCGGSSSATA